jgi:hypothetical protein
MVHYDHAEAPPVPAYTYSLKQLEVHVNDVALKSFCSSVEQPLTQVLSHIKSHQSIFLLTLSYCSTQLHN